MNGCMPTVKILNQLSNCRDRSMLVWVVTLCELVNTALKREAVCSAEILVLPTSSHGVNNPEYQ